MAFPSSPTNGQTATVNNIAYTYDSAKNAWTRQIITSVTVSGNVSGNYILGKGAFTSVNTSGNISGNYILGNGSLLTGLPSTYGNTEVRANLTTGFYGNIVPAANLTYNLGSTTAWWNTFYGVSTQARYADLAENYKADNSYQPGTVLIFGGTEEVTTTTISHDTRVAGVVSTNPGYLMNAAADGLPVAFTGRVPCLVKGPVNKGTVLVTSNLAGIAEAINSSEFMPGCILGKSLEQIIDNSVKLIEVVVGRF